MPCDPPKTNVDKKGPYEEYYLGERDEENRKHGMGEHHWSGPESLEWYNGHLLRDTMHGKGDYRWRYLGPDNLATTYEGRFYNNSMHGYGLMSYPDGRVFNGLFYKNVRWGPGVETHACLQEDVGLWYGYQLIRLAWRPAVPSVAIDLVSKPIGRNTVAPHRILLTTNVKIIGEVNSALDLLKHSGCEPKAAAEKWPKLYSKNCTDLSSPLCNVEAFDRAYYTNEIRTLHEVAPELVKDDSQTDIVKTTYYAWNNNKIVLHMMKHCFTHEHQRDNNRLNIENIVSGARNSFKLPGKHEMDCRTLIMASYLGHITNVATLINECDVMPDVTDMQGNSAIMYAACGDQPDTIHFLVEAGAEIDAYNDACCTPLGITLLRYVLVKRGVACNGMLEALLPPPTAVGPPLPNEEILEWNINRECRELQPAAYGLNKLSSKTSQKLHHHHPTPVVGKKSSAKELSLKNKTEVSKLESLKSTDNDDINASTNAFAEDKRVYDTINTEYLIRVAEAFSVHSEVNPIPYIFEVNDMCKDVELFNDEETKRLTEKTVKVTSKSFKEKPIKPSRDTLFPDKEDTIVDTIEQNKHEKMSRIMLTIQQLLSEGADPRKVRCPQPPLFIAAASGSAELICHLVKHGADIDEIYPQTYGYSTLDIAVSGPLTNDNLEVIRALLECGANPDHRLKFNSKLLTVTVPQSPDTSEVEIEGPTLLHAVLAKKVDSEADNSRRIDLRDQLLELLLQYGCNPLTQYKGHSAIEMAMNKSFDLFDVFIKNPRTDLNAVINNSNQSILLTSLLLFGADPLLKCQNGKDEYDNLFVFAKSVLIEMETSPPSHPKASSHSEAKTPKKVKSEDKTKKTAKRGEMSKNIGIGVKPSGKVVDDKGDYIQALDLVVECARLLYIRWLQAKLMKELIEIVNKSKTLRSPLKMKVWRRPSITFEDKEFIENEVVRITREHRLTTMSNSKMAPNIRKYVTPELTIKEAEKFNVCFECVMPLRDLKLPCDSCNLICFCSFNCMKDNIDRINCHPCSSYLKEKYFLTPEETEIVSENMEHD